VERDIMGASRVGLSCRSPAVVISHREEVRFMSLRLDHHLRRTMELLGDGGVGRIHFGERAKGE
jgi:hypothetical protein